MRGVERGAVASPIPLHAGNPSPMTGWGNWTYLFCGQAPLLIDAGVGVDSHLAALAQAVPAGPSHVVVTHAHSDHVAGVDAIASRWPETRFAKMPWRERDRQYAVAWKPLADGDRVRAGNEELEVIHTPGHAPDHIALWHAPTRTVFAGDLVVPGTTVVIPATMEGNLAAYLRSLERILALAPARLLPAHGEPVDDPAALLRHYLSHRREREKQIVAGLRAGDRTVDALVQRIYVGLKPALIPMAKESVLAHLRKLQEEGTAAQHDDFWALY